MLARAVGKSPRTIIKIGGVEVEALVDTGSQVTTLSRHSFERFFGGKTLESTHRLLKLTAANGLPIPVEGYMVVDVVIGDESVTDAVIIITDVDNSASPCLLGMNLLQRVKKFLPLLPSPRPPKQNLLRFARTLRGSTVIPPMTAVNVTTTAGGPDTSCEVLFEPLVTPPRNGLIIPVNFGRLIGGRLVIPVLNPTDEMLILPAKCVLGLVSEATEAKVSVNHVEVQSGGVGESCKFHDKSGHVVCDGEPKLGKISVKPDLKLLNLHPDLKPVERLQIEALVTQYADVFAWSDLDLGFTDKVEHQIFLTDDTPIAQPYRRVPPSVLTEVREHIEDLLAKDIIRPSSSPWASPIVVVRKKDGDIRMCVDYRRLNAVTRRDSFPLPRIDETLDAVGGARYFSTLDLASGYYQMAMSEKDKDKTAFTCPFGLYEFNRLPFGLTNAPPTFQRLMQSVMHDHIFRILLCYLDDLLVYSSTFDQHLTNLEKVFQRLREVGVKLKPGKCKLAQAEVAFLGHRLSAAGIATDPEKTAAVMDFKTPTTIKQVRSFTGLASYYRRFVKDFARIAKPLHGLIPKVHQKYPGDHRKGEKNPLGDLWTPECSAAFNQLKVALSNPPVLGFADYSRGFIVETDASFSGLGAVLSQVQCDGTKRVIAYASRTLRPSEKKMSNYSSLKLELLALKWAVTEKFRGYLLGHHFTVFTDNNPLSHWVTAKFGAVEQRWVAELAAFDFDVKYRSGKSNVNADCLSRYPVSTPEGPDEEFIAVTHINASFTDLMCPSTIITDDLESDPTLRINLVTIGPNPIANIDPANLIADQIADKDIMSNQSESLSVLKPALPLKNARDSLLMQSVFFNSFAV